jgi:hypothetical protein
MMDPKIIDFVKRDNFVKLTINYDGEDYEGILLRAPYEPLHLDLNDKKEAQHDKKN